ncbi:MAG: hypothetical protein V3W35_02645, partial [Gemmatimonadota bacterium]
MSAPARYAVRLLMLLPLAACGEEGAQPDTRAYVELLGRDTTALEVFTRADDRIDGTLVNRSPVTQVIRYAARLNPDGSVRRLETVWTTPDANPEGPPARYQVVEIEGDTA